MLDWIIAHNYGLGLGAICAGVLLALLAVLAASVFLGGYESRRPAKLYDRERDG